jgi:hypothetical protein
METSLPAYPAPQYSANRKTGKQAQDYHLQNNHKAGNGVLLFDDAGIT